MTNDAQLSLAFLTETQHKEATRRGSERADCTPSARLAHEATTHGKQGFLYQRFLPQSGEVTFLAAVIEKEHGGQRERNGGSFLSVRLADRSGRAN